MAKKKLMLIDGNSVAYRAFFALPLLHNDKGIYTNAIYGFTMMLNKVLADQKPTHVLVAFDAGKSTFRHKTYKKYKGTRQKTPSELNEQFPYIRKLLEAFQIQTAEVDEYEADDLIGTLSLRAEQEGFEVSVVSGDKDLTQLATDYTTVYITKKGITEMEAYTPEHIREKYGLTPSQIIDMKGLMGDSSDNIPGVKGVGEKTAIKLLTSYETVEGVYEHLDEVSGAKLKEKLEGGKDDAFMSKKLATIEREAPFDMSPDATKYEGPNEEALRSLYEDLQFAKLLEDMGVEQETTSEEEWENISFSHYKEGDTLPDKGALVLEGLDENYYRGDIHGIAVIGQDRAYVISPETLHTSTLFKTWLEDDTKEKIVYDSKRDVVSLRHHDVKLAGVVFDVHLAAYILNPSESKVDLAAVASAYGVPQVQSEEAVYGKGAKQSIPADNKIWHNHMVRKGRALLRLRDILAQTLEENEQWKLVDELEFPLAKVLADMEWAGIAVEKAHLEEMKKELAKQIEEIETRITQHAGESFNINSPKQLGVILFEKLGLPVVKKTKTGYSTSADVLEKLEGEHPIIEEILHYRQLGKLQSTYIEGLLKVIHNPTGKVHTRFNQALAQTGRLSSIEPNLQNIPIRLEEGRKIRKAFIPSEKDWVIFAADYSQIELRVLAHISGDAGLQEAFKKDLDIHTKTAMDVFHVTEGEVTDNMRRQAKAVNFGIVYGISDYGLSQNLGITRKEAKAFIDRYFESYPGVAVYMKDIVQQAKQTGYVSTLYSRRRYIPEITSRNFNLRSFAERTAMNTPIQGTAADIIKLAMLHMADRLQEERLQARLLLQVHDELIFEAPREEIDKLMKIVPEVMEAALALDVPLKVDVAYGDTWFDAK
ncbi:DNA polymerase I [Bacillus fonticola]|uniref:DNA polymerase I n=1 Tax=Bacillus fonticola TaxID=2728853 RepID=UPI001473F6F0|nr:DNA polymerase I [Bacillus fonticola]